MPDLYFIFYEDIRKGFTIKIVSFEELEIYSSDQTNYDCYPCVIRYSEDNEYLYIPNIKELTSDVFKINEIESNIDNWIIKLNIQTTKYGDLFYE
uniref:Uncharacterized protein n=1 Tax=viral metagenome TaxID=1070528 RepID=A0A6C0BCT6_9ZZZZ